MPSPTANDLVQSLVDSFRAAIAAGETPQQVESKLSEFVGGDGSGLDVATQKAAASALEAAPAAILDACLGLCYGERHGLKAPGPLMALTQAVGADPALAGVARARLAELESMAAQFGGQLERRCVISAASLIALRSVLAQ